jgi:hypothetical protein
MIRPTTGMTTLDAAAVLCWCLMSLGFVGTRSRVRAFNVICLMLLTLVLVVALSSAGTVRSADALVLLTGLALYWIGLLIVRVMLSRSVSLHLLLACSSGHDRPTMDDRLAGRLDDARKYHLVHQRADVYTVSRFGLVLDVVLGGLYRVVGLR